MPDFTDFSCKEVDFCSFIRGTGILVVIFGSDCLLVLFSNLSSVWEEDGLLSFLFKGESAFMPRKAFINFHSFAFAGDVPCRWIVALDSGLVGNGKWEVAAAEIIVSADLDSSVLCSCGVSSTLGLKEVARSRTASALTKKN